MRNQTFCSLTLLEKSLYGGLLFGAPAIKDLLNELLGSSCGDQAIGGR
jgi:hypothetical protein